jgi:hypothetical protein
MNSGLRNNGLKVEINRINTYSVNTANVSINPAAELKPLEQAPAIYKRTNKIALPLPSRTHEFIILLWK